MVQHLKSAKLVFEDISEGVAGPAAEFRVVCQALHQWLLEGLSGMNPQLLSAEPSGCTRPTAIFTCEPVTGRKRHIGKIFLIHSWVFFVFFLAHLNHIKNHAKHVFFKIAWYCLSVINIAPVSNQIYRHIHRQIISKVPYHKATHMIRLPEVLQCKLFQREGRQGFLSLCGVLCCCCFLRARTEQVLMGHKQFISYATRGEPSD